LDFIPYPKGFYTVGAYLKQMQGPNLERYTFDDDGRVYTDHGELWLPSVSTVLEVRDKPPALRNYLKRTSQSEQDEKTFYTQNRGTLIHYDLLSQLVEEEFWSDDEQNSEDCLKGLKDHEGTGLTGGQETWERYKEDREWAREAWDLIRDVYGINPESTLNVVLLVKNTEVGYAGQFDLLYEDDGDVVLADIKTSKRVYDKHLIQLTAYAYAVNITVDRMEVIRINPDSETWEISRSDEWIEDREDLYETFCGLRNQLSDAKIQQLKDRVTS